MTLMNSPKKCLGSFQVLRNALEEEGSVSLFVTLRYEGERGSTAVLRNAEILNAEVFPHFFCSQHFNCNSFDK